jgi:hypothetical protein
MVMMLLVYLKRSTIDIIGTFNGTANFAADVTLRRKELLLGQRQHLISC